MSTYGLSIYGPPTLYGPARPVTVVPGGATLPLISNNYLIDPFTAVPAGYTAALLTWHGPDPTTATPMNEFRLLSSRYGFPVDEDDGQVVFDTTSLPGSSYTDTNVIPGEITYYGFYILGAAGQWIRAGFTALLMPADHGYAQQLWNWLPEYLRDTANGELTADAVGDTYLSQFLTVAGYSLDYLKTQYDFLYDGQNDPMKMSLADLADLAQEIGMPFYGELPAWNTRKAAANWAVLMRQRGSLPAIAEHIDLLSGFSADIQLSPNIMLENDQSLPLNPRFSPWSASIPYAQGEIVSWPVYPPWVPGQPYVANNYVTYGGANYQCLAAVTGISPAGDTSSSTYWALADGPFFYQAATAVTSLPGTAPPGAPAAGQAPDGNSQWTLVYDQDAADSYLEISGLAGGVNTWEVLAAASGSSAPAAAAVPAGSLTQGIGVRNPSNFYNDLSQNTFRVYNKGSAAQDSWLRSVSRGPADITAGSVSPDPQLVIEHAIPVPQPAGTAAAWNPAVRYTPGELVTYNGVSYLALRASTGAVPPGSGVALNSNTDFAGGTYPWTGTGATVAPSSAYTLNGAYSMMITPDGTTASPGAVSETGDVIPGASYEMTAFAYLPAAWASGVQVSVTWSDAFGQVISTSYSSVVVPAAGTWTPASLSAQAPANAATFQMEIGYSGTPASSDVSYWGLAKLACTGTPEWALLGTDTRIPLTVSAQVSPDMLQESPGTYGIYPFAEWYDGWGNLITRVQARTPVAGTPGTPADYTFDGFWSAPLTPLAGRLTDTGDQYWVRAEGAWTVDGGGSAFATVPSADSVALVPAPLSATQAMTISADPAPGKDLGLVFWYQSASLYWHAGTEGLYYNDGGTWTQAAAYPSGQSFSPGDRIYVVTNQATPSVTVYRNSTASAPVAGLTGSAVPAAVLPAAGTEVYSGIASEAV